VREVLSPTDDERADRTSDIQTAIDRVGAGGGGVVLLHKGKYTLDSKDSLRLLRPNVVLRGEARGATFLRVRGPKRPVVVFGTDSPPTPQTLVGRAPFCFYGLGYSDRRHLSIGHDRHRRQARTCRGEGADCQRHFGLLTGCPGLCRTACITPLDRRNGDGPSRT
jgi:hypothetical protein